MESQMRVSGDVFGSVEVLNPLRWKAKATGEVAVLK